MSPPLHPEPLLPPGALARALRAQRAADLPARAAARFGTAAGAAPAAFSASGRAALHLALDALRLPPGDALVPAFLCDVVLAPLETHGLRPRPVDVDGATFCARPEDVEAAATPDTRLVLVSHTFGAMVDLRPFAELAASRGWALVEDRAHALGGPPCAGADASVYSLRKELPNVGGGALRLASGARADLPPVESGAAERLKGRLLSPGALALYRRVAWRLPAGRALGRHGDAPGEGPAPASLLHLALFEAHAAEIGRRERERVRLARMLRESLSGLGLAFQDAPGHRWTHVVARLPEGVDRDRLRRRLAARGVFALPTWDAPLGLRFPDALPVTRGLARRVLALPCQPEGGEAGVARVAQAVRDALRGAG